MRPILPHRAPAHARKSCLASKLGEETTTVLPSDHPQCYSGKSLPDARSSWLRNVVRGPVAPGDGASWAPSLVLERRGRVGGPTDGPVAAKSGREPPGTQSIWPATNDA
jgi:hypothetical protein